MESTLLSIIESIKVLRSWSILSKTVLSLSKSGFYNDINFSMHQLSSGCDFKFLIAKLVLVLSSSDVIMSNSMNNKPNNNNNKFKF